MHRFLLPIGCSLGLALPAIAQELNIAPPQRSIEYSPYLDTDYPNQVLFGDTHLHTAYSSDAGLIGATTTPDDAYRFAKGERVVSSNGIPARLERPLDFLVVSDHAENLGLPIALEEGDPALTENDWGRGIANLYAPRTEEARLAAYEYWFSAVNEPGGDDPLSGTAFNRTMWERMTEAAEQHNEPGAFSAMIGYEWTSGPDGNNLHRVVVYRDGKDKADRYVPFSAYDSDDPEDLWDWMANYETETGGQMLAIPHNGNLSNGLMFNDVTQSGTALTTAYAETRMRWEPIYEVSQIKGDGEAHPMLSPEDAFADYYTWDRGSFGPQPKTPDMLPKEYARSALKRGLSFETELGVNPFKFGMIGSTDSHTAFATSQEDNYFGKVVMVEPTSDSIRYDEAVTGRFTPDDPTDDQLHSDALASGLAAVWARENTREAIWDAMKRKEVFATTGTRIRVRVFGGWDFEQDDLTRSDFAAQGYARGVPMGGDLTAAPEGGVPRLLIRAIRDPDGANLDRIQVVKGWTTDNGEAQERVYNVVWSGDRVLSADGTLPPVGSTANVETGTYTNAIGAPMLETHWQDPEFDPAQRAFYYVRVLEIPTPSWLVYDRVALGVEIPEDKALEQQERAYTSPIWYTPGGG
ncbi:MAG: DUF3604 domain-containing protein [Paracoccaceae bacterium]